MKKIVILLMLLGAFFSPTWSQIKKSNLKILYVGGSTDWEERNKKDSVEYRKMAQIRMDAFEKMLKDYFTSVTVIHADSYTQDLSKNYDVTVMDGTPKPTSPRETVKDAEGKTIKYMPARYFTEDFDQPVVTIGELGETLGRRIGLKTDWYCLCLDADAHGFRKEHPIFNEPFPVKMTIVTKPTPEDAFHYAYFTNYPIPETLPMWQVQTKGYKSDEGFRVGMVARPWGFEDSPEAEYISSGVCAKTLDAVAIGRHGNFLHWGFAASPTYMTEEGKTVLANAIVYISKFTGKGIIARKYEDRIATREYLKELKYYSTRKTYEDELKRDEEWAQSMLKQQKEALAKKEKGETLTERETSMLNYKPQAPKTFEDFLKRHQRDFYSLLGNDAEAYAKFYDENYNYFYSFGFYHIELDEDVKSLGIPNNDKRILDEAIKLMESGKDVEKGKRILTRYTLVDFATAKEWRKWFNTYKDKLFFTEAGGFLYLINSREPGLNDYHAKEARQEVEAIKTGKTDDMNPVSIATGIVTKENGNKEIVVKVKVHPGYHIYANVSKEDPFIVTKVDINVPKGYESVGAIKKPSFKSYNSSGTTIYEDEVVFTREIKGKGEGEVTCTISYQCCDGHICFPPEEKEFTVRTL